jgi:uncharacterized membrane protein
VKRALSALLSVAYPVLILVLLRRYADKIPGMAAFGLKLYPVAVNAVLFTAFFKSLLRGPSAIEKLARLRRPNLGPEGVAYTRKVTQIWCAFFVFNGLLSLGLALWASTESWALYTGGVAYALMGLLFLGEWAVRPKHQDA